MNRIGQSSRKGFAAAAKRFAGHHAEPSGPPATGFEGFINKMFPEKHQVI